MLRASDTVKRNRVMLRIEITLRSNKVTLDEIDKGALETYLVAAVCIAFGLKSNRVEHVDPDEFRIERSIGARVRFDTDQSDLQEMKEKVLHNVEEEVAEESGDYGDLSVSVKALDV
jgi:hypothetical protein